MINLGINNELARIAYVLSTRKPITKYEMPNEQPLDAIY